MSDEPITDTLAGERRQQATGAPARGSDAEDSATPGELVRASPPPTALPPPVRQSERARTERHRRIARWAAPGLACLVIVTAPVWGARRAIAIETRVVEAPPATHLAIATPTAASTAPMPATPAEPASTVAPSLPSPAPASAAARARRARPAPASSSPAAPPEVETSTSAPAAGRLSVLSIPAARVLVDGVDTGRTTPVRDLVLAPGTHRLGLVVLGTETVHESDIELHAGESTRVYRRWDDRPTSP